eukprot:TRINITY_DN15903_c0_g1_i4.p1 TRINITY_DN15903_c0_g1~~TRINITY_DN15903_c0_g1_i4.p1  ORF type:complete len:192 (+),score=45.60 TRINITY_DN15903_c0_g1_i4:64-576(+)
MNHLRSRLRFFRAFSSGSAPRTPVHHLQCVVVRGVPFEASLTEVRNLFASCGTIVSARMPLRWQGDRGQGVVLLRFADEAGAARAAQLSTQVSIADRFLVVTHGTPFLKRTHEKGDDSFDFLSRADVHLRVPAAKPVSLPHLHSYQQLFQLQHLAVVQEQPPTEQPAIGC